jgi:hypothetical protein
MDEKMVAELKALIAQSVDYVKNGEYGDGYTDLPRESEYESTQIWDKWGNGTSAYNHDYACDFKFTELTAKYGYASAYDMFADIFEHVSVEYYFTSNQYYNCEKNRIEWGFYPVGEIEEQISCITNPDLHGYILGLGDDGLSEFSNACDCCINFQGKGYEKNEDVLIDITIYIGGAIVVYSDLNEAFDYLDNKDK